MRVLYAATIGLVVANRADVEAPARGLALVQGALKLASLLSLDEARDVVDALPDLDHAHIVCHRHGCKEVQAKLQLIRSAKNQTQGALQQCATDRAKLETDLQAVAAARGKVEADLAKCSKERAVLSAQVRECGKHRAEKERALGHCARERALLERELTQCAEVDRPAAEKALAECGEARQKLEQRLKELAEQAKNGVQSRRRSSRRRTSLLESNATDAEGVLVSAGLDEDEEQKSDEELDLDAQILLTQQQLEAETLKWNGLKEAADEFTNKLKEAQNKLNNNEDDFKRITAKMEDKDKELAASLAALGATVNTFAQLSQNASALGKQLNVLTDGTKKLMDKQADTATDLFTQSGQEAETLLQLLALMQTEQVANEHQLRLEHAHLEASLAQKTDLVALKERDGEECDELRAEVITLSANVATTQGKLRECLRAKSGIQRKTAYAQRAIESSRKGLERCLSHKVSLKKALDECKDRCQKTADLLKECLSRKKVLAQKIKECHTARDLARAKLKECLDRKGDLKKKIADLEAKMRNMKLLQGESLAQENMTLASAAQVVLNIMKSIDEAEAQAEAEAAAGGSEMIGVERIESEITQRAAEAAAALQESSQANEDALKLIADVAADLLDVQTQLDVAGADDAAAAASAHASGAVAAKALR